MHPDGVRQHFRAQVGDYEGLMQRIIPFLGQQREIMLGLIPFDRTTSFRVLDLDCGSR